MLVLPISSRLSFTMAAKHRCCEKNQVCRQRLLLTALAVLSHPVPDSCTVGYLEINLPISEIKELSDLVGPDSWFLIKLSKITDMSWLEEKVENW